MLNFLTKLKKSSWKLLGKNSLKEIKYIHKGRYNTEDVVRLISEQKLQLENTSALKIYLINLPIDQLIEIRLKLLIDFGSEFVMSTIYKEIEYRINYQKGILKRDLINLINNNQLDEYLITAKNLEDQIRNSISIIKYYEGIDNSSIIDQYNRELETIAEVYNHAEYRKNYSYEYLEELEKEISKSISENSNKSFIQIKTNEKTLISIFTNYFKGKVPPRFFEFLIKFLKNNNTLQSEERLELTKLFLTLKVKVTDILLVFRKLIESNYIYNVEFDTKKFRTIISKKLKELIFPICKISISRFKDIMSRKNYYEHSKRALHDMIDKLIINSLEKSVV